MPIWQWIKNNIPLYAEEITINQVEETLSKFEQPIPDKFIELGQSKKYWGSTESWKEPVCERYSFKYGDGKSATLDIKKELSDELELNLGNNFCVKEEVLSRSPEEGGITINNKEEIFLRKTFTIKNLKKDIDELFEKIKKLEEELEKERGWWDKWINDENYYSDQRGIELFKRWNKYNPEKLQGGKTILCLSLENTSMNWCLGEGEWKINELNNENYSESIDKKNITRFAFKAIYEYYKNQ